jgi:pSer/pThr/pTyr-binding forkhead associated (FHA) protein
MWILRGGYAGESFAFRLSNGVSKTMGRAPRADFILDAPLVSRVHCRVIGGEDGVEVEDLSSTNGTFVNDKEVQKGRLGNGDCLRIGRVELTVEQVGH